MKPKILLSLINDQQSFQRTQAEDARQASVRFDVDLEVVFAGGNLTAQEQQLSRFMEACGTDRPSAIVVQPVRADGNERLAEAAVKRGIGWVLLKAIPPYLKYLGEAHPDALLASVTQDDREIGRIQAEQFRALLPDGGNVVYVEGPGASGTTIERRRGMTAALQPSPVRIVKTAAADWTESGAEKALATWLKLESAQQPQLVGAQNDSMAVGARRAIQAFRPEWKDVQYTGVDGLPWEGAKLTRDGVLAATVVTPPTAGKAVEIAAAGLRGRKPEPSVVVPVHSFPDLNQLAGRRG